MDFNFNNKVGSNVNTIKFVQDPNRSVKLKFYTTISFIFQRMGAKFPSGVLGDIEFPAYVNSETIRTVIRNTCYKCGGLMQDDASALQNTLVSFDDFEGDAGQRGTTQMRIGPAVQVQVRKCKDCGHSHT